MANGQLITGFVLGVAVTLAARAAMRSQQEGGNPLLRAAGRSAAMLGEKFQEAAAELGEVVEDTVAELQAEAAARAEASAAAAANAGTEEGAPGTDR